MPDHVYGFGPFRLEVGERRLWRGDEIIRLPGKIFDTLGILVENQGHLVRRDELMKALWPDSVVEETNLDHNVSRIRKVLGQPHDGIHYIETVSRYGYRFTCPVKVS
jgi:DNA-binding winged helix-turn-helix (wHTH) protein